jgi:hypothetical protein
MGWVGIRIQVRGHIPWPAVIAYFLQVQAESRPRASQGRHRNRSVACGLITISQFGVGLVSISQFTVAFYALAQFACAYSLIAQLGIYIHEGHGR